MGFRRILALVISAVLLITPVLGAAEAYAFPAGELTLTSLSDSYYGGYQINTQFGFDVDTQALSNAGEKAKAAAVLLDKMKVQLSFYDDFGTARIRANVSLDEAQVFTGDMLILEDGSVQMVSNLTGNMAFTLPAGTVTQDGIKLPGSEVVWTEETFNDLPLSDRLRISSANMISTIINLLLGWVSGTQMETGELYAFDYETYIDATDTRDAVATRMIGKIRSTDLIEFIWNIVTHIRDKEHDFQAALAMSIGKLGLTRYEGRRIIDTIFPDEVVDPEVYYVQPSHEIVDDGALFTYNDLRYLLCKLDINLMNAWGTNTTTNESSMIVSYDDYGEMVGFDAELARFNLSYPYEGNFSYSVKTDEYWQRMHTAHGELQVHDNQRVIGDLSMRLGQDVGGINESWLNGQLDLVDQVDGSAAGIGVASKLTAALTPQGDGESIEANVSLLANAQGESLPLAQVDASAISRMTDLGISLAGAMDVSVVLLPKVTVHVNVDCVEYEETPFAGGQAVDLSAELTQEQLDTIKDVVKREAAALGVKLALKPVVLGNLLTLVKEFAQ